MRKILLALALISVFSVHAVHAINITLSEPLLVSPDSKSQTVEVGLDGIPANFIRKNGSLKDGKVKVKFRLSKAQKKLFSVSPKKGKLTINIKDGEITPASLTITAKDSADLGDYPARLVASKKLRKKGGLENLETQIQYAEMRTITGNLFVPSSDVSALKRNNGAPAANIPVQIDELDLVTGLPIGVLATGTTNEEGFFSLEVPLTVPLGPRMRCRTSDEAELNIPDPFDVIVFGQNLVLDPVSDFITDTILTQNFLPTLADLTMPEIESFYNLAGNVDVSLADSTVTIQQILVNELSEALEKLLADSGGSNPFFIPPSFDYIEFGVNLGQAIIGEDPENPGQALIGQRLGFQVNQAKVTAVPNDQLIFDLNGTVTSRDAIDVMKSNKNDGQGNEFFTTSISDDPSQELITSTGVKQGNNCVILIDSPFEESEDDFKTTRAGTNGEYAYDSNRRTIIGVDDAERETDTVGNETFGDFYYDSFRVIRENDGPVKDEVKVVDYGVVGVTTIVDEAGNVLYESFAGECTTTTPGTAYQCEGKKDSVSADKAANSSIIETFEYDSNENVVRSPRPEGSNTDVRFEKEEKIYDERDLLHSEMKYDGYDSREDGSAVVTGNLDNGQQAGVSLIFFDPVNGALPTYNNDLFKIYTFSFTASDTTLGIKKSTGRVQLETKNDTVEIKTQSQDISSYDSNLANSSESSLLPSLSQSSNSNATAIAGTRVSEGSNMFVYDGVEEEGKLRCLFPNSNRFVCQSANIGENSNKKEVGFYVGVKEE